MCVGSAVGTVALTRVLHRLMCTMVGCAKETCDGGLQEALIPPWRTELMQLWTELPVLEPWWCWKVQGRLSFMDAAREWTKDRALNCNQLSMVLTSLSTLLIAAMSVTATLRPLEGLNFWKTNDGSHLQGWRRHHQSWKGMKHHGPWLQH